MRTLPDGKAIKEAAPLPPLRRRRARVRPWIVALVSLVIAVAAIAAFLLVRRASAETYVTAPATVQDLTQSVTASGTVNAQNTILVGTQVSGTIQSLYADFNSRVRKGQVLARLDPTQFEAQLAQARGAYAQAAAQAGAESANAAGAQFSVNAANQLVASADANVRKAQSELALAQRTVARDKALLSHGYIAQSQYDADYANLVAAQSSLRSAQAVALQNRAQSSQSMSGALSSSGSAQAAAAAVHAARASVQQAQFNLDRTVIASPVDGTVVARNVSVGQTVAASFQTPTLFTIAQDLKKMEVDIAVGEPDIGNVRLGEIVSFSVLAYPNDTFKGTVSQVRVNPTTVQNVVTYTVIVLVDNANAKLLPGMTANASIAVATIRHALTIPLQALSYRPSSFVRTRRSPGPSSAATPAPSRASSASPWGQTGSGTTGAIVAGTRGLLFVLRDNKPQPVAVRIDLVSGMQAAVTPVRGTLRAGDAVITGGSSTRTRTANTSNPAAGFSRMVH